VSDFGVSLHYGMVMESRAGSDGEDGGTIMENSVVVYILFDSGWSPHGRTVEYILLKDIMINGASLPSS
jgi:hypothetical protein